ncbi:MAG TPA: bifunctional demethylmenaquinone methyltransferase/2-methoxy-6-polyprenyl-1,4-benzoquinol methylase UbiE [Candidatus Didemnitutus sp.]|jgi:demethylmenaquinone methyltransferase/2-methoxy-6-polyprenyl-1,4-benzoquinol methylase
MPDPVAVRSMFGRVAARYDLANHVLSGGMDVKWRQRMVWAVRRAQPRDVLDLATGSGDVAFALSDGLVPETRIVGADFCQPMLDEAVRKQAGQMRWSNVEFRQGDGLALPFPDRTFDAVTIAFGLRNMADRHRALTEMARVLRPQGRVYILEFSQPYRWFSPFYYAYLLRLCPWMAQLATGEKSAYEYLGGSIESFPSRPELGSELVRAGFAQVAATPMTLGIVALHEGVSVK